MMATVLEEVADGPQTFGEVLAIFGDEAFSQVLLRWADRLLAFDSSTLGGSSDLDLKAHLVGFDAFFCETDGPYLTLSPTLGKDHPMRAMQSAMSSASRTLAKLEALKEGYEAQTGKSIVFQNLVLTFPAELRGISEETAWKTFQTWWDEGAILDEKEEVPSEDGVDVSQSVGKSCKDLGLAALVNFHFWSSEDPVKPHPHFHIVLAMSSVEIDETPKIDEKGKVAIDFKFDSKKYWLNHEEVRKAWAKAITRVLGFEFKKDIPLRKQLDIFLSYLSLDDKGRARLLHTIKYNARRWCVDFAGHLLALDPGSRQAYVHSLTSTFLDKSYADFEALWKTQNRSRAYGWWRRLTWFGLKVPGDSRCAICGGVVWRLKRDAKREEIEDLGKATGGRVSLPTVFLHEFLENADFSKMRWIVTGKKGGAVVSRDCPDWARAIFARAGVQIPPVRREKVGKHEMSTAAAA